MQRKSQKKTKRVAQVNHPAEKKQQLSRTKKKRNNKRKAKVNNVETTPVKKFRLEEIEQARSYTEKFSSEPSLPYRRLDIFSTLVEGKDSCVAAGLINNQIVV